MVLDFVCVGPQRTGTTWLYEAIKSMTTVKLPEGVKETLFWDKHYNKGLSWYGGKFESEGEMYAEVGSTYFESKQACMRLKEAYPECKIVISLRNPIDRVISLYNHNIQVGVLHNISFEEFISGDDVAASSTFYRDFCKCWIEEFGRNNIFIVLLDDVSQEPRKTLADLFAFLNIKGCDFDLFDGEQVINASYIPRCRWVVQIMSIVKRFFRGIGMYSVVSLIKRHFPKSLLFSNKTYSGEYVFGSEYISGVLEDVNFTEGLVGRELPEWRASVSEVRKNAVS